MVEQCVEDLVDLGFTRLEAEIYVYLVKNGSATGYKTAKALGRPNSNTYRAMATLQAKGAVLSAEGDSRIVKAVDPDELLERLNRQYSQRHQLAADHLAGLHKDESDDRTYQLTTLDQVYGRVRKMLAESSEMVFLDLFPLLVSHFKADIEAAVKRGVRVAVQVYEPTEIEGAEVILQYRSEKIRKNWPGQIIVLIADGSESLIGALNSEATQVRYCSWTASILHSAVLLGYAYSELTLSHIMPGMERGASGKKSLQQYDDWRKQFPIGTAPAFSILKDRIEPNKS